MSDFRESAVQEQAAKRQAALPDCLCLAVHIAMDDASFLDAIRPLLR
jgi:hypothetical protein